MQISLSKIKENNFIKKGTDSIKFYDIDSYKSISPTGDVKYNLIIKLFDDEVSISGNINLDISLQCSRCSEFFSTTVHVSDFLRAYPILTEVDRLDITNDIREEILLNIPSFAICMKDCLGVCSICGINLNMSSCKCNHVNKCTPWSDLDKLDL